MALDGNLISTGQGEGEAIMLQPFLPDQSAFNQMNQNLARKAEQERADKQRAAAEREANRNALMEKINASYKYNPLDRPAIEKMHKAAVEAVERGDKMEIEDAVRKLQVATNDSLNDFQQNIELNKELQTKGETHHVDNADLWQSSLVENNANNLDEFATNMAKRAAAREQVRIGAEKIKDVPTHMSKVAQTIPPSGTTIEAKPDGQGQIVRVQVPVYDTEAVKNALSIDYQTHERDLKPLYPTENDYIEAGLKTVKTAPKVSQAFIPTSSATTGIAGEKNKKLNLTYSYGDNGEIIGADPQTVGGTATKEYATTTINGKPQKVRVEDTKDGKVTVFLPENDAIMKDYQKKRAAWAEDIKKQSVELHRKYNKTDADKELALYAKSKKEPINPNLPTTMQLEGEQAEKVWHQAYGVTLDQTYKGDVPTFVREDKTLKGKNSDVKIAKAEVKTVPLKIKELNVSVPLKKEAKGYQLSGDKKKAKITYKDGTTEIIVL